MQRRIKRVYCNVCASLVMCRSAYTCSVFIVVAPSFPPFPAASVFRSRSMMSMDCHNLWPIIIYVNEREQIWLIRMISTHALHLLLLVVINICVFTEGAIFDCVSKFYIFPDFLTISCIII